MPNKQCSTRQIFFQKCLLLVVLYRLGVAQGWSDCSEYFLAGNPDPGLVEIEVGSGPPVMVQCFDGWTAIIARSQVELHFISHMLKQ